LGIPSTKAWRGVLRVGASTPRKIGAMLRAFEWCVAGNKTKSREKRNTDNRLSEIGVALCVYLTGLYQKGVFFY